MIVLYFNLNFKTTSTMKHSTNEHSESESEDEGELREKVKAMIAYDKEMDKIGFIGPKLFFDDLSIRLVKEFEDKHKGIPLCWPKNKTLITRLCQIEHNEYFEKNMLQIPSLFNPVWCMPHCFICHSKYKDTIQYSQLRFLISYLGIPDDWVWGCEIKLKEEGKKDEKIYKVHNILMHPEVLSPEISIIAERGEKLDLLRWEDISEDSRQKLRKQVFKHQWPEHYPRELMLYFRDLKPISGDKIE